MIKNGEKTVRTRMQQYIAQYYYIITLLKPNTHSYHTP